MRKTPFVILAFARIQKPPHAWIPYSPAKVLYGERVKYGMTIYQINKRRIL